MANPLVLLTIVSIALLIQNSLAKSVSDHPQSAMKQPISSDYSYPTPEEGFGKRAMRNAFVRLGRSSQCRRLTRSLRSSAAMRNALVRFGKRSAFPFPPVQLQPFDGQQEGMASRDAKRNSAPEPFVRFGRSRPSDANKLALYYKQMLWLAHNANNANNQQFNSFEFS